MDVVDDVDLVDVSTTSTSSSPRTMEPGMARIDDFAPGQHVTFTKTFTDEDVRHLEVELEQGSRRTDAYAFS